MRPHSRGSREFTAHDAITGLVSLLEHDFRANAPRLSRGKAGFLFADHALAGLLPSSRHRLGQAPGHKVSKGAREFPRELIPMPV